MLVVVKWVSKKFLEIIEVNLKARNVAEISIETNNKALVVNNVLESEKIFRSLYNAFGANFGFGGKVNAGFHTDAIILKPTLIGINKSGSETIIIENGKHLLI